MIMVIIKSILYGDNDIINDNDIISDNVYLWGTFRG